jgi:hypothetical protein
VGATPTGSAHVEIVVYSRPRDDPTEGLTDLEALEREAGGEPLPALLTLDVPNNFPRLPVREDEQVLVTVTRYPDRDAAERLHAHPAYRAAADNIAESVQRLRLSPTPRSALR